jgi:uncharacterized protein YjbI with pentapeptide repeats
MRRRRSVAERYGAFEGGCDASATDGDRHKGASMKILNRWTDAVIFESATATTMSQLIAEAIAKAKAERGSGARAYLVGANLTGAYLVDANLAGADLVDADLTDAYLVDADLTDAYLVDADLTGAYLVDANLARANLTRANLARAYLTGADLAGADLTGANLARAYLTGADLAGAYLVDANLAGADLAGADLAGAYLVDANLAGADLAGADLTDAYLVDARNLPSGTEATDPPTPYVRDTSPKTRAERAQRYRERNPNVPVVERLDAKILERIEGGEGHLDMQSWHSCETTHCRAGWAIHLAGEAGYKLEATYGSQHAGAMIYRASTGRVPHFFASNERALEDIRRCAAEQTEVP